MKLKYLVVITIQLLCLYSLNIEGRTYIGRQMQVYNA